MPTIIDTLITRFGFQTDTAGADKAKKSIADFKMGALKVAGVVGAVLGGGLLINNIADTADEMVKFSDANGLAIESLGELEFAVQRQGGSVEGLRASLSSINKNIGEVERGTGRAKLAFEDYGISIKNANGQTKTADELLVTLNEKFAGLSKAQQFDLAGKMGIDKGTIRLLQTAPDEVARLRGEASKLGVLSRKDALAAADFNDGLTNMAQVMSAVKFEIGGLVFEPLSRMFKTLANGISYLRQHKDVIITFVKIISGIGIAYAAMGIKAAAAWVMALSPVVLIIAGIALVAAALAILVEDFTAFFNGQSSFIGDMVKKWPLLGDAIFFVRDVIVAFFNEAVAGFGLFVGWLDKVGQGIIKFLFDPITESQKAFELFSTATIGAFSTLFDWAVKIGGAITDFVLNPIDTVMKAIDKIPDISGVFNSIGETLGKIPGVQAALNFAAPAAALAPATASPVMGGAGAITKTTVVQVGDVNLDARGSNSEELAQNFSDHLRTQLQNTVQDFDSIEDR